jgi:hypothetical protein
MTVRVPHREDAQDPVDVLARDQAGHDEPVVELLRLLGAPGDRRGGHRVRDGHDAVAEERERGGQRSAERLGDGHDESAAIGRLAVRLLRRRVDEHPLQVTRVLRHDDALVVAQQGDDGDARRHPGVHVDDRRVAHLGRHVVGERLAHREGGEQPRLHRLGGHVDPDQRTALVLRPRDGHLGRLGDRHGTQLHNGNLLAAELRDRRNGRRHERPVSRLLGGRKPRRDHYESFTHR